MNSRTKRIRLALALVTAFVVATGLLWRKNPPQIITLPNGEQYQFVAAEWGTNQVQPTFAARTVARLPTKLADFIVRKWGDRLGIVTPVGSRARFTTVIGPMLLFPPRPPEPSFRFWFRSITTNANVMPRSVNFKFMLADKDGVIGGKGNGGWGTTGQGSNKWLTFTLPVVPRRSDTLQLHLFQADNPHNGPYRQTGTVRFRNPLFGHFPNWQPEPVPVTKTAGDLSVRLTDFTVGSENKGSAITSVNGMQTRFHPPGLGEDHEVIFKLDIQSPRGTNETWFVRPAELSDATGNRVQPDAFGPWAGTYEYHFGPALWTDEAAWRLKLTLRRSRGFDPEELVTFTNVPVPAAGTTSIVFQTNLVRGVPVVLSQEFTRKPDMAPAEGGGEVSATRVVAELVNQPEDFVVGFKEMHAGTGAKLAESGQRQTANSALVILFSIPTDVRTLDITWAVQKTRTVEFLVKPPKAE